MWKANHGAPVDPSRWVPVNTLAYSWAIPIAATPDRPVLAWAAR